MLPGANQRSADALSFLPHLTSPRHPRVAFNKRLAVKVQETLMQVGRPKTTHMLTLTHPPSHRCWCSLCPRCACCF